MAEDKRPASCSGDAATLAPCQFAQNAACTAGFAWYIPRHSFCGKAKSDEAAKRRASCDLSPAHGGGYRHPFRSPERGNRKVEDGGAPELSTSECAASPVCTRRVRCCCLP